MTEVPVRRYTQSRHQQTASRKDVMHGLAKRAYLWVQRSRQRSLLSELDDERLRDLGLSKKDVARECAKWFWR
jgi:uncharacterized protein YjiS (DUF1127 family)